MVFTEKMVLWAENINKILEKNKVERNGIEYIIGYLDAKNKRPHFTEKDFEFGKWNIYVGSPKDIRKAIFAKDLIKIYIKEREILDIDYYNSSLFGESIEVVHIKGFVVYKPQFTKVKEESNGKQKWVFIR